MRYWDTDNLDTDYSDSGTDSEDIRRYSPAAGAGYDCGPSNMSQSSLAPNGSTVSMEYPEK